MLQTWLAKLAGIKPEPEAPQGPSPLEILVQESGARVAALEEEMRQQRREMRRMRTALESLLGQQTGIARTCALLQAGKEEAKAVMDFAEAFVLRDLEVQDPGPEAQMLRDRLAETLKAFGLDLVAQPGVPFNPEVHQACGSESSDGLPDSAVARIVKPGFLLEGTPVRPAVVVVNRRPAC